MNNPFITIGYSGPEYFCDREEETSKQHSGYDCYVTIDEFQQITHYPEKGTEALLRSLIQFTPNIHFVFSGSKQSLMSEIFSTPSRPFFQSTQKMGLEPLKEDVYEGREKEGDVMYRDYIDLIAVGQQKVLRAIAQEDSVTRLALNALVKNNIVVKSERGYYIYDRYLSLWLQQ